MQLSAFLSFASQVEPKHVQSQSKSEWTGKKGKVAEEVDVEGAESGEWGQGLANGNRPRWVEREGKVEKAYWVSLYGIYRVCNISTEGSSLVERVVSEKSRCLG